MIGLSLRWARWHAKRSAESARSNSPAAGIGAESPIRTASEDRLRRSGFADRIANVLSELSPREGRVFAIRGRWGFGKSSLKNLITERLDSHRTGADWLDFNPWQWGSGDVIARALFTQISNRLGGVHSTDALKRAEILRRYGAILTGAGGPLKTAASSHGWSTALLTNASVVAIASAVGFNLPTVAKVAAALAALAVVVNVIGRVMAHFGRDRGADPIDDVRRELEAQLRNLDRPLVVFVDDIDRLEPEQIRMLLRQVKANANLPNIVFVLLFQASIVEQALDPVVDGEGRAFLEKIVQANFDLPVVPPAVVHRIFAAELAEVCERFATEANGFSYTRWGNVFVGCIQPFLLNVRDARRLLSSIAIHLPLHVEEQGLEVNLVDFLLLETLRVFEPDLRETLGRERTLVLQERRFPQDGRADADRAAAVHHLEAVAPARRNAARDAVIELFPTLEWAFGGMHYEGAQATWLVEKRVCVARYFPRYFELLTPEGEISDARFNAFLAAATTEERLTLEITALESDGLLPSLAARLDEAVDRLPLETPSVLLLGMFRIGEALAGDPKNSGPFNSPWISAWRATNWFLARLPTESRGPWALAALRQTEALSVADMLIHLSDPEDRKDGEQRRSNPVLDGDEVVALKGEWLDVIRRLAKTDALMRSPSLISWLYRWRDYSGSSDEPLAWVRDAVRSDEGFISVITRMKTRGTTQSSRDRVSTPMNKFERAAIETFLGLEETSRRAATINPAAFPEHENDLVLLKRTLADWGAG